MSTLKWHHTQWGNWSLRKHDNRFTACLLSIEMKHLYIYSAAGDIDTTNIPFPEGVTDVDELKAWALAIYRMS